MTIEQAAVLALGAVATLVLALEKAHITVVGIGLMVIVALTGLADAGAAVGGFGNKAVVTVGALYVVGEGFLRTGAASLLANRILSRVGGEEAAVTLLVMVLAAVLSAFVNNTLVVVTFLPVITTICRETGLYPSRLLIPLSYASIVGGMTTLVGTSTNLLVSQELEAAELAPIGMFEMSGPGLLLAAVALIYVAFIGRRLLPRIPSLTAAPGSGSVHEYVTEITVGTKSPLLGIKFDDVGKDRSARVSMVVRGELVLRPPFKDLFVREGDILAISGHVQELAELHHDPAHRPDEPTEQYDPKDMSFFEVSMSATSNLPGERVRDLHLKAQHGAVVVGLLRNGQHIQSRLADLRVGIGDVLLAFGSEESRESVRESPDFHIIEGVEDKIFRREKAATSIAVILGVVTLFVIGVTPVSVALAGALTMVMTGCLTVRQATRSVNWPILMFISGMLALSEAMQETGTSKMLGATLYDVLGDMGPYALLAGIYFGTIVLTELLSNNAVAVVMAPIAIAASEQAGVADPRALVLAVAFGASTSFANPIGYQTNLLVLGPGGYRFSHFLRVGLGLDVLLGATGVALLPMFFPMN